MDLNRREWRIDGLIVAVTMNAQLSGMQCIETQSDDSPVIYRIDSAHQYWTNTQLPVEYAHIGLMQDLKQLHAQPCGPWR
ncbi:hypothetical protein [Glaciimonas immobilis]|uniref:Uncharacterized protein n=1 Tax=Glaciimonas immobilis TaxID=728004 RepID=A0A840RXP8_9BURK|nr:hypothetical protein [Glaciimonas immobilis]KAF3998256.1 hypothetical protein HAV38_08595 [Glaciimonas immobilis]MBB5201868.1 hypothetical protein [Glaciimonas immobilis]